MYKKIRYILVILFFLFLLFPTNMAFSKTYGQNTDPIIHLDNAYRFNSNGQIYLHIEGNASERGFQHGFLLAYEIKDLINRLMKTIHNQPFLKLINMPEGSNIFNKITDLSWSHIRNRIYDIYWDDIPLEYKYEIIAIADGVNAKNMKVNGRDIDYVDILVLNQFSEYMIRANSFSKGIHPFRSIYNNIDSLFQNNFLSKNVDCKNYVKNPKLHHCSAFIATGNATTNGQIVIAQELQIGIWFLPYYATQRENVIIDIIPSDGYRFQMISAPGKIWSGNNFYQNEKGIMLVDTTAPQGLWSSDGYPMSVRTRMVAQYAEDIDNAIYYLENNNNGLWSAVYLLGDAKTGEIARFELALYNSKVYRKKDGYLWSANNAMDTGVRLEGFSFKPMDILLKLIGSDVFFGYKTIRYSPFERDIIFKELGDKYYGFIDSEVVKKKIMNKEPISNEWAMNLQVSDSDLLKINSLWAFWGNCGEKTWDVTRATRDFKEGRDVPPVGWVLINGIPEDHEYEFKKESDDEPTSDFEIKWELDFGENIDASNMWNAELVADEDIIYATTSNGFIYALNGSNGEEIWKKKINKYDNTTRINHKGNKIFIGWMNESIALNKNTFKILWKNNKTKYLCSKPGFLEDKVFYGSRYGDIFALDSDNGEILWNITFDEYPAYPRVDKTDNILIATCKDKCYSINPLNGNILWDFTSDGIIHSEVEIYNDKIFFGSSDTDIYAINKTNGRLLWKNNTGWSIQSKPTAYEDILYIGSMDHNLYAYNTENSEKIWTFCCKAAIRSNPVSDDKYVYFGSDDGRFYVLNRTNGKLICNFTPSHSINDNSFNFLTTCILTECVLSDDQIIIGADGRIISLSIK